MFEFRGIIANRNINKQNDENAGITMAKKGGTPSRSSLLSTTSSSVKKTLKNRPFGDKKNIFQQNTPQSSIKKSNISTVPDPQLTNNKGSLSTSKKLFSIRVNHNNTNNTNNRIDNGHNSNIGNGILSNTTTTTTTTPPPNSARFQDVYTSKSIDFLSHWSKNCILSEEKINDLLLMNKENLFDNSPMSSVPSIAMKMVEIQSDTYFEDNKSSSVSMDHLKLKPPLLSLQQSTTIASKAKSVKFNDDHHYNMNKSDADFYNFKKSNNIYPNATSSSLSLTSIAVVDGNEIPMYVPIDHNGDDNELLPELDFDF